MQKFITVEVIFTILVLRLRKTSWIVVVTGPKQGCGEMSAGSGLQSEIHQENRQPSRTVSQLQGLHVPF